MSTDTLFEIEAPETDAFRPPTREAFKHAELLTDEYDESSQGSCRDVYGPVAGPDGRLYVLKVNRYSRIPGDTLRDQCVSEATVYANVMAAGDLPYDLYLPFTVLVDENAVIQEFIAGDVPNDCDYYGECTCYTDDCWETSLLPLYEFGVRDFHVGNVIIQHQGPQIRIVPIDLGFYSASKATR